MRCLRILFFTYNKVLNFLGITNLEEIVKRVVSQDTRFNTPFKYGMYQLNAFVVFKLDVKTVRLRVQDRTV